MTPSTDTAATRSIEYVRLDDVLPADRNPKRHDHTTLQRSFERFGFVEPIVRDDRTQRLVAGHGRIEQLRMARARDAERPPPGVTLDDSGDWLVPVIVGWRSRDDLEAQAYLVAANRTVESGGWDDTILLDVLSSLEDAPEQLDGIGYSLDDMLAMLSKSLADDADDDARPQLEGVQYRVVVDCDDEQHQARVLEELSEQGLSVRAVMN